MPATPFKAHLLATQALDTFVRAPNELEGLHQLAPPLLRSCATNGLFLLPGLSFPLGYVRRLISLLLASVGLTTIGALVVMPLLHATLRPKLRAADASAVPSQGTRLKLQGGPQASLSYNTV